jgi:hypothetical protein
MRRTNDVRPGSLNDFQYLRYLALALLSSLLTVPGAIAAEPVKASESRRTLIVSLADRKLALIEDGRVLDVYDVAVGSPRTPSPTGDLRIINKVVRPTYYHRGVIIGPSKNNPLGPRWMGLSRPGYGIHGTNEPKSIGKAASHGCIRMRNREAEELFKLVQVGDSVEIHSSRDEEVSRFFPEKLHESHSAGSRSSATQTAAVASAVIAGAF